MDERKGSILLLRHITRCPVYQEWSGGKYLKFETGEVVIGLIRLPQVFGHLSRGEVDHIRESCSPSPLMKGEVIYLLGSYCRSNGSSIYIDPANTIDRLISGQNHMIQIREQIPQIFIIVNWGMWVLDDPNPKFRDSLGRYGVEINGRDG